MKNKIITSVIAATLFLVAVGLSGCGKKEVSDNSDMPKLKYYSFCARSKTQDGEREVFDKLKEIAREEIGVDLEVNFVENSQYEQQMTVKLASNEKFDLMFTAPWLNNYSSLVSKGALLAIDELLPVYAKTYYESIPSEWWECTKINGKIYGAINQQVFARQSTMVYLDEALQKTGFDYQNCEKLEDLEPFFAKALEAGYNTVEYILWNPIQESAFTQYLGIETIGGDLVPGVIKYHNNENITVLNQFELPEYKDAMKLFRDWNLKGYIAQDALVSNAERLPIFKFNPCYKPLYTEYEEKQVFSKGKDVKIKPVGEGYLSTSNVIATMLGVAKVSEHPEKAVELINLINTNKEFYNTMSYGIEGRDYKIVDNKMEIIPNSVYNTNGGAWAYGNQFMAYVPVGLDENVWKEQDNFNRTSYASPILGFNFDLSNVQTEIANCNAVISEYLEPFKLGFLDLDEKYPEFLKKLKDAGCDKIIAEKQAQIDKFLASKN